MQSKSRIVSRNIISAFILQLVASISGFVIPKIILVIFGSEINGLVSSINHFLGFISLFEGGLGAVVMAALYKPLQERDDNRISSVVNTAKLFYRKIALIYLLYVLIVSLIYPLKYKVEFSYSYVCVLVWLIAINQFTMYFFSNSYRILIQADQKSYIVSLVQSLIIVLSTIAVVLSVRIYKSIAIIKLIGALIYSLQSIIICLYVKKHYNIDKNVVVDSDSISQRWDGFWHNLAYFIHTNTDVVVLTLFATLKDVSVYTTYLLIINALKTIVLMCSGAVVPTLGNTLAKGNKQEIDFEFDIYEISIFLITSFLFSAGISLILPFVSIYTRGIKDTNYYQPLFSMLMITAETVFCLREPYLSIVNASGHFKQTKWYAIAEASINIVVSVILVKSIGLVGVAIGTLVAMLFRATLLIIYSHRVILNRSMFRSILLITVSLLFLYLVKHLSSFFFGYSAENYLEWIVLAVKTSLLAIILLLGIGLVFFRKQMKLLYFTLKSKLVSKP